ncbi:MAG: SGNH/GDSL hydrolase family protein [Dehalococcoidia bacterium]|nr:SGNH/GDSL hydrolase family protein [Dehalococcoidia bacterium]
MAGTRFIETSREILTIARAILKTRGPGAAFWYLTGYRIKRIGRPLLEACFIIEARLRQRPVIHAIGDSHVKTYRGKRPFVVHHLGAATAHNLANASSTTGSNRKLLRALEVVSPRDAVLLLAGEIDCRIHIYYQFMKRGESKSLDDLVEETVINYGRVLEMLRDKGFRFAVHGVPPATKARNEYRYPFYATPEAHSRISSSFNAKMRSYCEERGYAYIDVHSRCSDSDGFMMPEYAADEIHLNRRVVDFVRAEIEAKLGLGI